MVRPTGFSTEEPVEANRKAITYKRMEARIEALGREIKSVRLTLLDILSEQKKFHEQLVAVFSKPMKRIDDNDEKIKTSENHSIYEVRTIRVLKNQEMKEVDHNNIDRSPKTTMKDDQSMFGGAIVVNRTRETPISSVKSQTTLDLKLGTKEKKIQAAYCPISDLPPPKPPDADLHTTEVMAQITASRP